MALKIRLRQLGKKNYTVYRLVLTDVHSKRDGKYIDNLGWYNPNMAEEDKKAHLVGDRIAHWLTMGAIPSEKAIDLIQRFCPQVMANYSAKLQAQSLRRRQRAKKGRKTEKGNAKK